MKILIWTISFGAPFRVLTKMFLDSLLRIGKWDGDIVVLSDRQEQQGKIRFIDIRPLMNGVDPMLGYNGTKGHILDVPGVWDYDYLQYLDSDVLVNSPRVRQVLTAEAASTKFAVQKDRQDISSGVPWTGYRLLTEAERKKHAKDSICSGMFGFTPTNAVNREILTEWHGQNRQAGYGGSDQKRMILLLFRKYPDAWKYMDRKETGFWDVEHDVNGSTFLHFSGPHVPQMGAHYEKLGLGKADLPNIKR